MQHSAVCRPTCHASPRERGAEMQVCPLQMHLALHCTATFFVAFPFNVRSCIRFTLNKESAIWFSWKEQTLFPWNARARGERRQHKDKGGRMQEEPCFVCTLRLYSYFILKKGSTTWFSQRRTSLISMENTYTHGKKTERRRGRKSARDTLFFSTGMFNYTLIISNSEGRKCNQLLR